MALCCACTKPWCVSVRRQRKYRLHLDLPRDDGGPDSDMIFLVVGAWLEDLSVLDRRTFNSSYGEQTETRSSFWATQTWLSGQTCEFCH